MQKQKVFLLLFTVLLCFPAVVCSYLVYMKAPNTVGKFPLSEKWSYEAEENIRAIGSSEDGVTILRTANYLVSLDSVSGDQLWSVNFQTRLDTFAPEFYEGMVFVTNSKGVWAFDEKVGDMIWQVKDEPRGENKIVAASSCCVFVSNISESVVAYNRRTGERRWSILIDRGHANVFVEDQIVYIVNRGIRALDESTGEVYWEEKGDLIADSGYANGVIYYADATSDTSLIVSAFDVQDRKILWQTRLSSDGPPEIVTFDEIIIAYSSDLLIGLEPSTGETLWHYEIDNAQTPAILNDVIYSEGLFTNSLYAIEAKTGQELGYLSLSFPNFFPAVEHENVAVADDLLVVAEKNKVYGYGK